MDKQAPDALVTGYRQLVPALNLPDPNDGHVLAAAVRGGASMIVTNNIKDFPAEALVL
ncbi:PIN domain-containing protein [Edaphobacter aggregans]|uniref:PIN domain-containing protein n=1 Tax=Edaphobacter aggregans TaxID=570835 RepID=UPI0009FF78DF|nr:PIN domain-containing protein [Edaphobacter aggregans]